MPFVRTELVVLCVAQGELQVLLSRRAEEPHAGKLGLPGGVLRIDEDATLEGAAQRVARERLGRELPNLHQLCAVGGAERDPRAPWALSVVYRSLVQPELAVTPGKRVQALEWRAVGGLADHGPLAFDHGELIDKAVEATRAQIEALDYPPGWVQEPFTLPELQAFSAAVLGRELDKVTFRRRVEATGQVEALQGEMRSGGAHRPAQLYRFAGC
ncbi:MAG: NUDIX hydrolase [Burkholderiales bacterium]|nr:NUDIX hydrolase [Burkholderiales bacterium]